MSFVVFFKFYKCTFSTSNRNYSVHNLAYLGTYNTYASATTPTAPFPTSQSNVHHACPNCPHTEEL